MDKTKSQHIPLAIEIVKLIGDCIRETEAIPAGHLYALLMPKLSLEQFHHAIGLLKTADLITEENNVLVWKGVA
jgi:hypothetical protein